MEKGKKVSGTNPKNFDNDTEQTVNFERAIQNLSDVLVDHEKFNLMNRNLFDAMDTDNKGSIDCNQVETFIREFLRGDQKEGEIDTNFEHWHEGTFKMLRDNEAGEVTMEELAKVLWELLRYQVVCLQRRLEEQTFARAIALHQKHQEMMGVDQTAGNKTQVNTAPE